jgi:hypothetical protein
MTYAITYPSGRQFALTGTLKSFTVPISGLCAPAIDQGRGLVTVLDPRAVIRDDRGIVVFDGGPPARRERVYSEPTP